MKYKMESGFTLIEMLVVIAIIGILATFIVLQTSGARDKTKISIAQSDVRFLRTAMMVAQQESGQPLATITGNGCTECSCRGAGDMRNTGGPCFTQWQSALSAIEFSAHGTANVLNQYERDPWGSPYALDENERETGQNDCRMDTIRSMGPDGIYGTGDDIGIDSGTSYASITPSRACP